MMRFYAMGNYYLSSIQQGIQAAHALGEMTAEYSGNQWSKKSVIFHEWVQNHKTMVLLNGGNSLDLQNLWLLLTDNRNTEFPVSKFHEDHQSLHGALTSVAIVLPERLYDAKSEVTENGDRIWRYTDANGSGWLIQGWEAELLDAIKKLPLAR